MNSINTYARMGLVKKIETLKFQLDTFSKGIHNLEVMSAKVKVEWDMEQNSTNVVNDNLRAQLNRVIHATRAFDTGLRLFLDKFGARSVGSHSISDYIRDLQRNAMHCSGFNQLDGTQATRIQKEVTNERNKYCHAAGTFPTNAQADFLINRILEYYSIVMGLEK